VTQEQTTQVRLTVLAASFGFGLVQLDVTIVNVALPQFARSLHADTAGLQWIVDAYALVFAALLLSAGFFGDRFGARRIYLAGLSFFAVGSLVCGLSPATTVLIAGRVIQGVGAAAMMPCSLALLNHAAGHDTKLRAKAVGWWTAAGGVAIGAGPIVGGLLLAASGWRSIFLVNLPICLISAVLALKVKETAQRETRRGFDIPGQVSAILAMGALTAAFIEVRPLGVFSPVVLAAIMVGVVCTGGFIWIEKRARTPMLPLALFAVPSFTPALLFGVVVNMTYYGIIFVLSLYLQQALQYGPLKTGLAYLPLTTTFIVVNVISGWWVGRAGSRMPMIVGALIDAIGFALLLLLGRNSSYWLMLPAFALMPGGMGLGVPAMTTAVLASVDKARSGLASGVLNAARQAGGAVGVAIFGALASGDADAIAGGLHRSAMIAVGLLVMAAAIAAFGMRNSAPTSR
jgi:MFS transporter, DHA2 family, methylenomycin A resistance protein